MAESDVPQLVDKKGGSYSAIAPRLEDFQKNSDDEVDERNSLVAETFEWDEEDVSYDDEEVQVKVLMALAVVELVVGKNHARDGFSQNFSYPRTPEQNGVAKRKNKTLIEVARIMLNVIVPTEQITPHTEESQGPLDLINTEGTSEQGVQTEHIDQVTDDFIIELPLTGDHSEIPKYSVLILIPHISQSPITHQAPTSSNSNQYPQDRWSREQHIELVNIIGEPTKGMLTRSMVAKLTAASAHECLFADFLYEIEPKKGLRGNEASRVKPLLAQIFGNTKDEHETIIRNKAILVAQGYRQEEGIIYDKTFAHVARMKAIRIFLAYATYMNFKVFQIDVKSAFLDGKLNEEVYVQQPPGFEVVSFLTMFVNLTKPFMD
ncbi:retrovirus-related pol polyprotein from transposon TNT 1-94 [Tanacetum coccineum]|uniref:Retrovirus-related pol polyprotein from transposon TNT 1-94 n=1 Tax=Tanacetum coccineum TaxID=301880 RepID=A0ABQ5J5R4_9ASTR